ncbi:unnamed protein product [Adineta steineri]|uniref:F-box domain-containing protein n=1 Tax=Adineta steineri TaxID=433720 RepID=A0A818XME3_9BILA|nr:unnamed protein product [Adineta steineri]
MASIEDLCDELVIMIWNKLNNFDVFYSFMGVNKRFDRLVRDVSYTRSIQLFDKDSNNNDCSLPDILLDRLCFDVLPQIHDNIEWLTLEPLSMERILCAAQYSRLYKLTLVNFGHQSTRHYFTNESPFANLFKQRITHLNVSINFKLKLLLVDSNENLYAFISSIFTNLIDFNFTCHCFWRRFQHLTIDDSYNKTSVLQNVINLRIDVDTLDDCLRLLDGRLIYLRKFIVNIYTIESSTLNIGSKILTNLRYFSLTSRKPTTEYDNYILPLLQRMINLENLILCLRISWRSTYIDGFHFDNKIFIHMPQLRTFDFEITTSVPRIERGNQLTNHELQNTFIDERYRQVISYIDNDRRGGPRSHIFSLPYTIDTSLTLSSNFPGGLLSNIRHLLLMDHRNSFEHQFFKIIAQSFPYLTDLSIHNHEQQEQHKRLNEADENNPQLSIIEFSHLNNLRLGSSHIDYAENFLDEMNTRLPCLIHLDISYENLEIVTENFTRDATRRSCAQLNRIQFHKSIVLSQNFYLYFSSLK